TPCATGVEESSATRVRPSVTDRHTYSKWAVSPRITTPSATTASQRRASAWATTGSSTDPETCATTMSVTLHAPAAASARSSIWFVRSWCQRVTAMPSRSPLASTVYSFGDPNPANSAPLPLPVGDLVQLVEHVPHPVPLGPQVAHVLVVHPYGHRLP